MTLLNKYKGLFGGSLVTWDELKEVAKLVFSRAYPLPKSHKIMLKKENKFLEKIGVLECANDSEWGAPSFAYPKKTVQYNFFPDLGI